MRAAAGATFGAAAAGLPARSTTGARPLGSGSPLRAGLTAGCSCFVRSAGAVGSRRAAGRARAAAGLALATRRGGSLTLALTAGLLPTGAAARGGSVSRLGTLRTLGTLLATRRGAGARLLLGPRDVCDLATARLRTGALLRARLTGRLSLTAALLGSGLAGLLTLGAALLGARLALLTAALAGRRLLPARYVGRTTGLAGFAC